MPASPPLPEQLADGPFLFRDGREAGLTAARLRAKTLDRSLWGIRSAEPLDDLRSKCAALALRMPPLSVFSHVTAAQLYGMPLPWHLSASTPIHIASPTPSRAPHAANIRGHQLQLRDGDVVVNGGLRVTSIERTWFDLALVLHRHDLIAAGDFLIHYRSPMTSVADLAEFVESTPARRGTSKRLDALANVDARAESPPESKLRMILKDAGAPALRVNHAVTDRFGEFVGHTDLIVDEWKLILEYQGDYHRTMKGQWRSDMTRRSKLEAQGWRVIEVNADDLRDPTELVERILRRVAMPI